MTTTTATRPAIAAAARRSATAPVAPIARPGIARPAARPAVAAAAAPAAPAGGAAFGLVRPTVVAARAAVERVYGAEAEAIWSELLGETVSVGSAATIETVVELMITSRHDIVRLCGQALQIRLRTHEHLSAAQSIVG